MKKLIIILISVFTFQFVKAQEFVIEKLKYDIVQTEGTKQKEYTANFDVITADGEANKVGTFHVSDLGVLDDVIVRVLTNPNLENIKEVIRVDVNYSACCSYNDAFYFLVTNDNEFISLPHIENVFCEETVSEVQYIFPTQKFGKENLILKTEITYDAQIENITNTEVLQSLVWNDDDFDNNESITSISTGKNY